MLVIACCVALNNPLAPGNDIGITLSSPTNFNHFRREVFFLVIGNDDNISSSLSM